ncbi:hypothetical protein CBS147346_1673 [Aspergillus niger]|nr:hypothetical protein CBS147346_1673 [Aspergillus niger]
MKHVTKLHLPRPPAGLETDVWNLPNEIESQITTLAAIIQVQHQQRTPLARKEDEYEAESEDAESSSDEKLGNHGLGSSAIVAPLASESTKDLKRCFLDRLAELLCYEKDAHYVTCTYLREGLEEVTILASRNATWKDKDISLLESLASTLEQLAVRDPFNPGPEPDLERKFSEYYTPRLDYHAEQLIDPLKTVEGVTGLVAFLKDFLSRRISSHVLVNEVKEICYNTDFYSRIKVVPKAKKIVQELGFICRPLNAADTFYKAAREISNFKRVKIELLPGYKAERFDCSLGRPIDEVDYFIIACKTEELPKDDDVAKAFGLLYFTSAADLQRLFRLYCRLVNEWGVEEDELREAWQQNKLKEFILFRSSQIPSSLIHAESHWLSQQNGFAANKITDFNVVFESQKHILKREDQQVPYEKLKPREKLEAYVFLCQIRNGYVPDADEDNWIYLGFCTARDGDETQQLAKLYRVLVDRCEFEEFWKAMAESKMVDLFRKYGLGHAIKEMRNFEILLRAAGTWYQSVWELKRFTRVSCAEPHRSVLVDYGFSNCRTLELSDLRQAYTKFFTQGGDEMALHEACIQGQLASFLESELGGLPISAELVSNPYPLEGRDYVGMVVIRACLCPQSSYEIVKEWQKQTGIKVHMMTYPDECDEAIKQAFLERSRCLGLPVKTQTTMMDGKIVESMSGM